MLDENVAPGTINEVGFMNVYTKGKLAIDEGTTGVWALTNKPDKTTWQLDYPTVVSGTLQSGQHLLSGLMMIPQHFTENNQKIYIKMTVDGVERDLYADLKDTEWKPNTTVNYMVSTSSVNVLRVGGVTYPANWGGHEFIKTAYAVDEDAIGVYAIDAEGKVVLANAKYEYRSTGWKTDESVLFNPTYTYYAYYPYKEALTSAPALNSVIAAEDRADAKLFFKNAIAAWTIPNDQSTDAKILPLDLQVGRFTVSTPSTIGFEMEHAMGLLGIELGTQTVTGKVRYHLSTNSATTYDVTGQSLTSRATDRFLTKSPYKLKEDFYYLIVKNDEEVTISSVAGIFNEWSAALVATLTAGSYETRTVYPKTDVSAYTFKGVYFNATGAGESIETPAKGYYSMECWGAEGGTYNGFRGGYGGYTAGDIWLNQSVNLFAYVGKTINEFNGGITANNHGLGSGGATDIRLSGGNWDDTAGLRARIIVAGGGGGGCNRSENYGDGMGGYGGGLIAGDGQSINHSRAYGYSIIKGGEQDKGGTVYWLNTGAAGGENVATKWCTDLYGQFGMASRAMIESNHGNRVQGTGGGGWYGGGGGGHSGGGGGSSFISGHAGCNPVNTSTGAHLGVGKTTTFGGREYKFTNIRMIDGDGYNWPSNSTTRGASTRMPNTSGGQYAAGTGRTGDGYCRIAFPVTE